MRQKIQFFFRQPAQTKSIIWVTLALYVLPIGFDLIFGGWERVFSYYAADTFYYLEVAKNFAHNGLFSFDTQYATNGFHPLWQVSLGLVYKLLEPLGLNQPVTFISILGLDICLIACSIVLLANVLKNQSGRISVWFALLPVGFYGLIIWPIFNRYGTLWSFTNGMESGLLLFSFSLLSWFLVKKPPSLTLRQDILVALLFCLVFLSRLDHIFLLAAFVFVQFVNIRVEENWCKIVRRILVICVIGGLVLGLYMIANKIYAGTWMPVSGAQKSSFPHFTAGANKISEITRLLAEPGKPGFGEKAWRYCQIIFPIFMALPVTIFWFFNVIFKKRSPGGIYYPVLGVFVIFLGLYNFLFVSTFEQGHWYFPVSIMFMSLVSLNWLENRHPGPAHYSRGALLLLALLVCGYYAFVYHDSSYNTRYAWFYHEAPNIQAYYRGQSPRILEYDDGIITYTTNFEGMSGFGFVLDTEALAASSQHRLLDLAYQRGYRYIASYYYFGFGRFNRNSQSDDIKNYLSTISYIGPEEVQNYKFRVDYLSADGRFSIIEIEKIR